MIGSGISSIGQSSTELIIGRAINGLGAAGIFQGAAIILDDITHPSNKPWTFASIGLLRCVVFGSGPIITGSIIDKAFWKWIFYVNIPIGVAVIIAIFLFFEVRKDEVITPPHYRRRPLYYGATLFSSKSAGRLFYILATMLSIFSVIDALLAINWGGRKYFSFVGPWIGILAGIFIISVFFSLVGYFKAYRNSSDDRWIFIVPLRIFRNRSLVSGILFAAPINSGFWVLLYYVRFSFSSSPHSSILTYS
jgi:MFS family permease